MLGGVCSGLAAYFKIDVVIIRIIFIALIASGGFLKLEAIWILADIVNGLMAIPNLIALIALSGVVVAETESYLSRKEELHEDDAHHSAIAE